MPTAVVAIFAHKETPAASERISLRQCARVLSAHPLRLVCPAGMNPAEYLALAPSLQVDEIDPRWLSSLAAYNHLKVSRHLYKKYAEFDFLLTYELDSFVFRDELDLWCDKNFDYIGAPWFEGFSEATAESKVVPGGNSGFSLRKIRSCLRVLDSHRGIRPIAELYREWRETTRPGIGPLNLLAHQILQNRFRHQPTSFPGNEDVFWSQIVPSRFPWWNLPDRHTASLFSFEMFPRKLYQDTGGHLPFGCHKWEENEPDFWHPHMNASAPRTAPPR